MITLAAAQLGVNSTASSDALLLPGARRREALESSAGEHGGRDGRWRGRIRQASGAEEARSVGNAGPAWAGW